MNEGAREANERNARHAEALRQDQIARQIDRLVALAKGTSIFGLCERCGDPAPGNGVPLHIGDSYYAALCTPCRNAWDIYPAMLPIRDEMDRTNVDIATLQAMTRSDGIDRADSIMDTTAAYRSLQNQMREIVKQWLRETA